MSEFVRVLKRKSEKHGEDYLTIEMEVQKVGLGKTPSQVAFEIEDEISKYFSGQRTANAPQSQVAKAPQVPTDQGSLAAYSLQQVSADLDGLTWTQQQSKKGWWIFWNKVPLRTQQKMAGLFATDASPKGYIKINGYNYARTGDDGTFLNRYSAKVQEQPKQ